MIQRIIQVDRMSVDEARKDYGRLFFTFQQYLGLNEEDSAIAVSIATGVCPHCWEEEYGCQCWNDE